jgi:hypothetical protein
MTATSEKLNSIIRLQMGEEEAEERAAAFLAGMLEPVLGDRELGNLPALKNILDGISEKVESGLWLDTATEAVMRHRLGITYLAVGDYEAAASHLECARSSATLWFGDECPRTRSCMLGLGLAYLAQGRSQEAIALFSEEALNAEAQHGKQEPGESSLMQDLQLWYVGKGQYWSPHLRHPRPDMGSRDDPNAIALMAIAAMRYVTANKGEEAERLFLETLLKLTYLTDADNMLTVTARQNLAMFYVVQKRYEWARAAIMWRPEVTDAVFLAEGDLVDLR